MDTTLYLTFLAVSFGLIIILGPNVLVIVSTSITHGTKRGLQAVAGTSLAMTVQLLIVTVGTTWFVHLISNGLYYIKWLGVIYLLYVGVSHLKAINNKQYSPKATASSTFTRGFLISLTNPKTLLFFSAFLPQFVSSIENYHFQLLLLSISFLSLAIVLDSTYAVMSSKLGALAQNKKSNQIQNGISGILFLGASTWLALTNRST